jgi:hypothetical protein
MVLRANSRDCFKYPLFTNNRDIVEASEEFPKSDGAVVPNAGVAQC